MASENESSSSADLMPSGEVDMRGKTDEESKEKKLPYPTSVFFIVSNEFCERFSYYGMKAVLTLYLKKVLKYDDDLATVIYHIFSMFAYFTPLFGAMIADSLLGKFRTIFYLSVVYCLGNVVLSLAATPPINLPPAAFSMIGLALIAIGTGGIKPCVAAFGGDQFKLPEQEVQLASFFSVFYFSINSGSLLSTILTPIFREDVKCFEQESCFSLAFAVPAALMITALVIFLIGKPMYVIKKPSGNIVIKLIKCIAHAISNKGKRGEKEHWLDNAEGPVYDKRFIEDVKIVLRVLLLYVPLPVFWALFDQQGSRWTLQANRMDGLTFGFTIKPDQVQVLNPALILIFIPLFDQVIYPLLAKCNILKKPLQRLTTGGILAGIAFVSSGIVELQLEDTYPVKLTTDQANLQFINTVPCNLTVSFGDHKGIIPPFGAQIFEAINRAKYEDVKMEIPTSCEVPNIAVWQSTFSVDLSGKTPEEELGEEEQDERAYSVVAGIGWMGPVSNRIYGLDFQMSDVMDNRKKPEEGFPILRFFLQGEIFDKIGTDYYVRLAASGDNEYIFDKLEVDLDKQISDPTRENVWASESLDDLEPIKYKLFLEIEGYASILLEEEFEVKLGGGYVAVISENFNKSGIPQEQYGNFTLAQNYKLSLHTITEPSSMHMFWLLPQYIIITMGEIMFSVTGLEFSYSQAPVSMKSVLQAAWLLTVAFGNLIVVIVAEAKFFEEQSKEFFLFAGLMFVDMALFSFMAWRYIPAQLEDPNAIKEIEEKKTEDED